MNAHPDYLSVPERYRWDRPLNELFGVLQKEAWAARGQWRYRVLPHGALVSVRVVPPEEGVTAFATLLRIARKDTPKDDKGWQAWSRELAVFLKHMGGEEADWQETARVPEKCDTTFRFVLKGKAEPKKCVYHPDRPAIDPGLYREDLCRECAIEKANKEVAENNQARLQL